MKPSAIKAALADAAWSQADIADELGIKSSSVSTVINGKSKSERIETLVSEITGIPLWELWPDRWEEG